MHAQLSLHKLSPIGLMLVAIGGLVLAGGCARSDRDASETARATVPARSGAQLWSENCAACHNMRPPGTYSDSQWAVSTHHMRILGNLTGQEERAILQFLQSAN